MNTQVMTKGRTYQHVPTSELEGKARELRLLTIEELYHSQSGHPGPSLSVADIVTDLFFDEMNWGHEPDFSKRDRFLLSKGHAAPVQYAVLAQCGYIPKEELKTLRQMGSRLQGHPVKGFMPDYVHSTTGALGQGLSVGLGTAKYFRQHKKPNRVYVILGDGELQEGQVWEAAMSGGNYKHNNIVGIVDRNGGQNDGFVKDTMPLDPLDKKFEAFGWNTITIDGHDFSQIQNALDSSREVTDKPTMIIANTDKGRLGKGKIFMNGVHSPKGVPKEDYEDAVKYLEGSK